MRWFEKHRDRLREADEACRSRGAYSPFIESPRGALHPEGAKDRGLAWFESVLGTTLENTGPHGALVGQEVSPYTRQPLGVRYHQADPEVVFSALHDAGRAWRKASPQIRVGLCLEALERLSGAVFENTFATMHTTGQGFIMAFAGSGANSLDRGLEAVVYAHRAMRDVPASADFERAFGKGQVKLHKRYKLMPRGPAVVIACGSYPAWNAWPALFANLATGNPVVLKPHPGTILPVARGVQIVRALLAEAGFDPNLVILAPDEPDAPITAPLVERAAIVDFTGSPRYGAVLERLTDKLVYTETAGCNAVLLTSVRDLDPVLDRIAHGLCMFSGQMCTTPQNLYIPSTVQTADGPVSFDEVCARLVARIDALVASPKVAAGVCGAVHSDATVKGIHALAEGREPLRAPLPYTHPVYPKARTLTPLVLATDTDDPMPRQEHFGPVAFCIRTKDRDHALVRAARDVRAGGSIASYAYSTDAAFRDRVEDAFFEAGASIGFNLIGHSPMSYTAAFSDYHVTGLNPAGNACLTDLAFVASRFRIVQSKTEQPS